MNKDPRAGMSDEERRRVAAAVNAYKNDPAEWPEYQEVRSSFISVLRRTPVVVGPGGAVDVHVPSAAVRTIPVHHDWADNLARACAHDGDATLVGMPGPLSLNALNAITRRMVKMDGPNLSIVALRHTWMVEQLNRGVHIKTLRDSAGVNSLGTFNRLLPWVEGAPREVSRTSIRGGVQ